MTSSQLTDDGGSTVQDDGDSTVPDDGDSTVPDGTVNCSVPECGTRI